MKIAAISDMHGMLYPDIKKSDILCICGDFSPLKFQRSMPSMIGWLKKRFIPWCESLDVERIFIVAGNHDFIAERSEREFRELFIGTKITYLCNESATYTDENGKDYVIYGTPLCSIFGNSWAFMESYESEVEKLSNMPNNVDIMLCHDAPMGTSDVCLEGFYENEEHIGNDALTTVISTKKPKILLHGHLHSSNHEKEVVNDIGTEVYNVSLLNESYELAYKPLYLAI
jgi:Icc-related predicted phosphoesterase